VSREVVRRLRRATTRADDERTLEILASAVAGFVPSAEAQAAARAATTLAAPRRRVKVKQGGRAA
jgi:hypothetical protein